MPKRKLAKVPAGFDRIAKAGHAALLSVERDALRSLRSATGSAVRSVLAASAGLRRRGHVSAVHAVNAAAEGLKRDAAHAIAASRDQARRAALVQLGRSLTQASAQLRKALPSAPSQSDGVEDHGLAIASADSLGSFFRTAFTGALLKHADGEDGALSDKLPVIAKSLDARARRIATTEVSRAFSDEHLEATDALAKGDLGKVSRLFANLWDATLDGGTCEICAEHDGEIVQIGTDYEDNDEPGEVHPCCRCMSMAVLLPFELDADEDEQPAAINVEEDLE